MASICNKTIGNQGFSSSGAFYSKLIRVVSVTEKNDPFLKIDFEGSDNALTLAKDEYICEILYGLSDVHIITYLKLKTNLGRSIEAGNEWNPKLCALENIRLLMISGVNDSSGCLRTLTFTYINNYQPSTCVAANESFILDYSPPLYDFEELTNPLERNLHSYRMITADMINRPSSFGVEAEFVLKIATSLEIDLVQKDKDPHSSNQQFKVPEISCRLSTIQEHLTEIKPKASKKARKTIPGDYVGVKVVNGDLMKGEGGIFWMFPTSVPSQCMFKLNDVESLLGRYDLTGQLYTQMPKLKYYKTVKNSYVYYAEPIPNNLTALNVEPS